MARYALLKWNGKSGAAAQFVVRDNNRDKQGILIVGRPKDIAFVKDDLAGKHQDWEDFEEEPIDVLEEVII